MDNNISRPLQISFENLSYSVKVPSINTTKSSPLARIFNRKKELEDKFILRQLCGTFRPGRLTAILGPSGSGKTTLLNLLAGQTDLREANISGDIWVNGRPVKGAGLRQLAGYVNQDDVILPTQTVEEAIEMSIVLRPPPPLSLSAHNSAEDNESVHTRISSSNSAANSSNNGHEKKEELPMPAAMQSASSDNSDEVLQRQQQVERRKGAISQFGLDKCRSTAVGDSAAKGISGGEKKRTAIAMEWVTEAPVLFLDEPTSGLDAHSALSVTHQLRDIAQSGRTVVAVLHQPSSEIFNMIDDILILFEGRIVYLGERENLVDYVARLGYPCGMYTNPADHVFNAVLYENPGSTMEHDQELRRADELQAAWAASRESQQVKERVDNPLLTDIHRSQFRRTSPAGTQFKYLLKRSVRNALRNKLIVKIRLAQSVMLGLLIGLIFLNSNKKRWPVQQQNFSGAMFFSANAQFMLTILGVVNVFASERLVFLREWQAGYYSLPAYFLAKNVVELPIQIISPILFSAVCYYLLGLRHGGVHFVIFMVVTVVMSLCGFFYGLLLGAAFESLSTILVVLPAVILPVLLFGGLLVNTSNSTVWLRWIQWLSPVQYAYTSMMKNQFKGLNHNGKPLGDEYLNTIELSSLSIGVNIVIILAMCAALLIGAYGMLAYLTHRGRGSIRKNTDRKLKADLMGPPDSRFVRSERRNTLVAAAAAAAAAATATTTSSST